LNILVIVLMDLDVLQTFAVLIPYITAERISFAKYFITIVFTLLMLPNYIHGLSFKLTSLNPRGFRDYKTSVPPLVVEAWYYYPLLIGGSRSFLTIGVTLKSFLFLAQRKTAEKALHMQ